MIAGRAADEWIGGDRDVDLYDLKGALTAALRPLGLALEWSGEGEAPAYLHPRRFARLTVSTSAGPQEVGVAGELHPDVTDAVGLEGHRAAYAELSVDSLYQASVAGGTPLAPHLPRFPSVTRDLALLLDRETPAGQVVRALTEAAQGLAERVELFDVYEGEHVPEGKRSLAFRLVYRDPEATLTDKRVDTAHARVVKAATSELGAVVR